jgi:hypothetical protein
MKKVINNLKIIPIKVDKPEGHTVKGCDMFAEIYSNIFLCAKKGSGKTNVVFNILKNCADKRTNIIFFSSTHNNDANYIYIKEYLRLKKIPTMYYDSIFDRKHNILQDVIDMMRAEDKPESDEDTEEKKKSRAELQREKDVKRILGVPEDTEKKKERPPKKISPKFIIICDDLPSIELRSKTVDTLLKTNRHFKSKVIISSQWLDLNPAGRRQLNYYLLFKGINDVKLESFYELMDLDISYEKFMELYKDATHKQYNFFFVDTLGEFRQNFNEKYLI